MKKNELGALALNSFFIDCKLKKIMLKNKYIQWPWLILLLLTPFILWVMPADFFDSEDGVVLCLSRLLFDVECWGCGMTRAVMHFHHFDFTEAIYYNTGVVVFYPALIAVWYVWVKAALKETGVLKKEWRATASPE